jgi:hypothetical protein
MQFRREHVSLVEAVLAHLVTMLKPGGKLLIGDFSYPRGWLTTRAMQRGYYFVSVFSFWLLGTRTAARSFMVQLQTTRHAATNRREGLAADNPGGQRDDQVNAGMLHAVRGQSIRSRAEGHYDV